MTGFPFSAPPYEPVRGPGSCEFVVLALSIPGRGRARPDRRLECRCINPPPGFPCRFLLVRLRNSVKHRPMSGPRTSPSLPVFLSQWLVRAFVGLVTRLCYPLRVSGLENLPRRGGVLLVSNHVSFVDWLLLTAAAKRPVRFFISWEYYESPWFKPLRARRARHPRPARHPPARNRGGTAALRRRHPDTATSCAFLPRAASRARARCSRSSAASRKSCGAWTRPSCRSRSSGVWGSIFSFAGGKFFWKWPRRLRRPVTVSFGRPLPPTATADEVRATVEKLLTTERDVA